MQIPGTVEVVPDADIIVFRNAVDTALLSEIELLWESFAGYYYASGDVQDITSVQSMVRRLEGLPEDNPIVHVGKAVVGENIRPFEVVFNQQQPFASQQWHPDGKSNATATVHVHHGGAFDYLEYGADNGYNLVNDPEKGLVDRFTPPEFKTLELNCGDVVLNLFPNSVHRGRNRSDTTRNTLVFFSR